MLLDFKTKTRPAQVVTTKNEKNSLLLAIANSAISFDKETYKNSRNIKHGLTIVRVLAPGWASCPYKKGAKSPSTKKLYEFNGGATPSIRIYAFEKAQSNSDKGPRCDDVSFELHAGNVLSFWVGETQLGEMKDMLAGLTHIPAFTLCEIQVASKNHEAVGKGYAYSLKAIKPMEFTLHSCLKDVERFPSTMADSNLALLKHQDENPAVARQLIVDEPSIYVHCGSKAYIFENAEPSDFVTLVNTGIDPIDIPVDTLLRYTNCLKKEKACNLLEMAIANDALELFVVQKDFWKSATQSVLRGVPIINTELLLQNIIPSKVGEQTCFKTPYTLAVDDVVYDIQIHVEPEPVAVAKGPPPKALDFVLTDLNATLERAYKLRFALSSPDGDEIPRYWVGYFDASPRKLASVEGFRKRKFVPEDEEDEDE